MNDFPNYLFSFRIFIFVNDSFPFVRIQAPPSFPVPILFPKHDGLPFIRVHTSPTFYRHFEVQADIRRLARRTFQTQTSPTDNIFPIEPFYVFLIRITFRNFTNQLLHDNLGSQDPPNAPEESQRPPTSPSLQPRRLRRVNKRLPPPLSISPQPQPSTVKPLPPPPYHLRPPTYYSRTTTPASTRPPSINDDATSPTVATRTSASRPLEYIRHVLQRVRNSLRRHGRRRHEVFVPIFPFSLTTPFPAASKPPDCRCLILVDLDGGCRFLDDDYVVSSMRGSDNPHITKTSPHHQRIVRGMPPNQLTQVTIGFPHPRQLGRAIPCYVFLSFLTMEQFTLCLVTTTYATYATYAQYATYAPYAPSMPFLGCDEIFLIPIMLFYVCSNHGHFSYLQVCMNFGLSLPFTDFLSFYKNLAYEIDSKFCWLMFFEALKLKFELETNSNKFILDLGKIQVSFSLMNFNFYFSNDLKMNLDFKFIKFPAPYLSELPFIKFPAKSRKSALLMGQSHYDTFRNPISQNKVSTLNVKSTSHSTSHGPEAIGNPAECSRTLNLRLRNEANKPYNLIKFPATPGHTTNPLNLINSTRGRVLSCIADLNWNIKEFIFRHSRSQWTLPKRLDFNESELLPDKFIMTDQDTLLDEDDEYVIYPTLDTANSYLIFTAYKRVGKKIHPVSTQFPIDCRVTRQIPEDPLLTLPHLPTRPPEFTPTAKISMERLAELNINPAGFLWPEEEKLFQHVMKLNETGIAFEDIERGTLKDSYFSPYIIPTIPHLPWEYRNIPIPKGLLPRILEVLKLKMAANVYEHSQSSYRSQWFVVLKKNGKLRIVHDLQPLNQVTIRDAGMLPVLDDFVEGFAGRECYTVFDLFWGFDARKIHKRSRDLTAFMTPLGLLQITSLPTGFTNSPAEFQKCMVMVLEDEIPHTANIFIDDLPIKGPATQYLDEHGNPEVIPDNPGIRRFVWEHAQDVHRVLHRVLRAGATISSKKAQICLPEALIVGQRCNAKGREPDTDKVDKILKWPPLTTPKEVRRFLGLCGTVRVWIPNYSQIVRPLSELYHQDKEFIWDQRRQDAFDEIKRLVTSAPALRPIDYTSDNPVILSVDSSQEAAGMILSQIDDQGRRRPARYGSVPMSERESRYSQPKLELFGLYRALRHWRLHIIGVKNLRVEVDAKYIKGMLNEPDLQPNAAINRWIQGILLFDFALVHVPADKHKGPDALSRRTLAEGEIAESDDDSWLDNIALLTFFPTLRDDPFATTPPPSTYKSTSLPSCFSARITQENTLSQIHHFLETLESPIFKTVQKKRRFIAKAQEFIVINNRLYKRNGDRPPLTVIRTPEQKLSILKQAHEGTGHRGIYAVTELIRQRYFWPYFRADIYHHIKSCHDCQIRSLKRTEIPLTISAPTTLFSKIYVDIMHMPESADKYKYIVAARDDLSGTCEARALQHATSSELSKFFFEEIYCRYGAPLKVVTDNGPEIKKAFEALLKRLGIRQIRITPYNHHANGVVERGHFILREAIVKACKGDFRQWPSKLPEAVFADRVTISRVTGFSPYQLLHATDPLLPLDLVEATFLVENIRAGISTSELLALRMRQIRKHPDDLARAAKILQKARFASKAQFEQRFIKRLSRDEYKSGELVLVRNTGVELSHNRKHQPRYLGPYEVDQKASEKSYSLKDLDGTPFLHRVGTFRLLPYISRRHEFMNNPDQSDPSDSGTDDSDSQDSGSDDSD
jgi:transposase InsO family protein